MLVLDALVVEILAPSQGHAVKNKKIQLNLCLISVNDGDEAL